jgi:hypothetical protein
MLPAGILAFMLPVEPEEGFYADPPIQRWTKPLRGRFHEVSIDNCQLLTGTLATRLNTSRSFL